MNIPPYLLKDRLLHIDMTEPIRRGRAEILYEGEDGVLLRETKSTTPIISAASPEAAARILDSLQETDVITLHQTFILPELERRYGMLHHSTCYQAAWFKDTHVPELPSPYEIRFLTLDNADEAGNHYREGSSGGYIRERIEAGEMLGAFDGSRMAGFVGLHGEGAMGMLEVFPEYRRKGIAQALTARLSNLLLEKGCIPFSQFYDYNSASRSLHEKLGFDITSGLIHWAWRE